MKCCGYPEEAPPSINFVYPLCRCDLAEFGKSQAVQGRWQTEGTFCFGCGDAIHDKEFDWCDFCNSPYGFCCSARRIVSKGPFRCPSCIGISTYDAAVDVWQKHSLDKVSSIITVRTLGGYLTKYVPVGTSSEWPWCSHGYDTLATSSRNEPINSRLQLIEPAKDFRWTRSGAIAANF